MATISITLDATQSQRVATAFGRVYGLGRDATLAEVKGYIVTYIKGVVTDTEKSAQVSAIVIPDVPAT